MKVCAACTELGWGGTRGIGTWNTRTCLCTHTCLCLLKPFRLPTASNLVQLVVNLETMIRSYKYKMDQHPKDGGGGGGGGWGGGEGGAASWEGGAVDGGSVNAFLAAALARVMRVAVPIPAVASASVFHSAAVGGSVVGDVRPL